MIAPISAPERRGAARGAPRACRRGPARDVSAARGGGWSRLGPRSSSSGARSRRSELRWQELLEPLPPASGNLEPRKPLPGPRLRTRDERLRCVDGLLTAKAPWVRAWTAAPRAAAETPERRRGGTAAGNRRRAAVVFDSKGPADRFLPLGRQKVSDVPTHQVAAGNLCRIHSVGRSNSVGLNPTQTLNPKPVTLNPKP